MASVTSSELQEVQLPVSFKQRLLERKKFELEDKYSATWALLAQLIVLIYTILGTYYLDTPTEELILADFSLHFLLISGCTSTIQCVSVPEVVLAFFSSSVLVSVSIDLYVLF